MTGLILLFIAREDAQFIVNEIKVLIGQNVNLMDENGIIAASTDKSRIGQVHEGARLLLQHELSQLVIHRQETTGAMQEGINLPIRFGGQSVGVIGITGEPESVAGFGQIARSMTELLIDRSWKQLQAIQLDNARRSFLENLLFSESLDFEDIMTRAKLLDLDPFGPCGIIALQAGQGEMNKNTPSGDVLRASLLQTIMHDSTIRTPCICTIIKQRIIIFLYAESAADLKKSTAEIRRAISSNGTAEVYAGISSLRNDMKSIRSAYQEAKTALRAAVAGRVSLVSYGDVSLELVVQSIDADIAACLSNQVFHRVTPEQKEEMLQTLNLFFGADGNTSLAAQKAYIHRNTLLYRIKRIGSLTGYDLFKPRDAALLYIVLMHDRRQG